MFALLQKEISGFFSSLTAYVVILVFTVANGLFMWVFPGELNIMDSGYASIETLFIIAPWVFLLLVPAITMKMISEEKKTGTIEQLLTQPISDIQIILAKYFSAVILVLISLIPALIYFYSVYQMGTPVGNMDVAGTMGAFIGLFMLAAAYASVGIFTSSITDNQIVAFILAVIISFFLYIGFDSISGMIGLKQVNTLIAGLGINEHYKSISRGVIDSRDVIYFVVVISLFVILTRFVFQSRKW